MALRRSTADGKLLLPVEVDVGVAVGVAMGLAVAVGVAVDDASGAGGGVSVDSAGAVGGGGIVGGIGAACPGARGIAASSPRMAQATTIRIMPYPHLPHVARAAHYRAQTIDISVRSEYQ
jgi:hypothetical protein